LPKTGPNMGWIITGGVAMAALGNLLLLLARRRRSS
jgi:LPXTG-motif cell wall-anchored protein